MGQQAEYIADKFQISRGAQDNYACESQRRATHAMETGAFADEIVPVDVSTRGGTKTISCDQGPRPDMTLEKLAQLKPAFNNAGNASQISDGAEAVVVTSARVAADYGIKSLARVVAYATSGVEPKDIFIAPMKVLDRAGLLVKDIDLIELNEAFAAQMIACAKQLNVHGGAISLGHPLGASDARVLVTLLYAMRQRGARPRVALSERGNVVAMVVEV